MVVEIVEPIEDVTGGDELTRQQLLAGLADGDNSYLRYEARHVNMVGVGGKGASVVYLYDRLAFPNMKVVRDEMGHHFSYEMMPIRTVTLPCASSTAAVRAATHKRIEQLNSEWCTDRDWTMFDRDLFLSQINLRCYAPNTTLWLNPVNRALVRDLPTVVETVGYGAYAGVPDKFLKMRQRVAGLYGGAARFVVFYGYDTLSCNKAMFLYLFDRQNLGQVYCRDHRSCGQNRFFAKPVYQVRAEYVSQKMAEFTARRLMLKQYKSALKMARLDRLAMFDSTKVKLNLLPNIDQNYALTERSRIRLNLTEL